MLYLVYQDGIHHFSLRATRSIPPTIQKQKRGICLWKILEFYHLCLQQVKLSII